MCHCLWQWQNPPQLLLQIKKCQGRMSDYKMSNSTLIWTHLLHGKYSSRLEWIKDDFFVAGIKLQHQQATASLSTETFSQTFFHCVQLLLHTLSYKPDCRLCSPNPTCLHIRRTVCLKRWEPTSQRGIVILCSFMVKRVLHWHCWQILVLPLELILQIQWKQNQVADVDSVKSNRWWSMLSWHIVKGKLFEPLLSVLKYTNILQQPVLWVYHPYSTKQSRICGYTKTV